MPVSSADLVAAASAIVPRIEVDEARRRMANDDALLLDIRDAPELQAAGRASGSHHVSRGMLEFRADPASPLHDPELRPDRPIILHCAAGPRAALAGKLLHDMGYKDVSSIGGFKDWVAAGGPVDPPMDPGM